MNRAAKLLPFFIIEWYAKRYCERITIPAINGIFCRPFHGAFFSLSMGDRLYTRVGVKFESQLRWAGFVSKLKDRYWHI